MLFRYYYNSQLHGFIYAGASPMQNTKQHRARLYINHHIHFFLLNVYQPATPAQQPLCKKKNY